MVEDGVRTTVYIRRDLKALVDREGLNLSRWVNEMLERFLSVSSVEDVKRKLVELEERRRLLEERLKRLREMGVAESKEEAVRAEVWEKLKELYRIRRMQGVSVGLDDSWIRSKANVSRVAVLGLSVDEVLKRLEDWYVKEFGENEAC